MDFVHGYYFFEVGKSTFIMFSSLSEEFFGNSHSFFFGLDQNLKKFALAKNLASTKFINT